MREEVFLGGLGGQGVLLGGQMLARAGMDRGLNVSWFPIYSPEVRGGYTTCTVVITDGRVGSPLAEHPGSMIIMDPSALRLFGDRAPEGGLVVLNSSLIEEDAVRDDVRKIWVPANDIAADIGNDRVVNMTMIGAWAAATGILSIEDITASLKRMLPERHHKHMPANEAALRRGADCAECLVDE
ncbi:MAG: 2-oxoacid:acceptor oxidoreductase family protein [Armatimonadetes bacterium]|nr:2-oxoacid:acceptor oxidoreductase family protein [Armatimonadota bacterium]